GVTGGQLRADLAQAAVELPALAAHALQGLAQSAGLGALGFQLQRQGVGLFARFARGGAGLVAGRGQARTLGLEFPARAFEFGHARHRLLEHAARLACLLAAAGDGLAKLGEFGIDALDAVAGGVEPALLALQPTGKLRHAAMRVVQLPLRVLARLFGRKQALADRKSTRLNSSHVKISYAV